MRMRLGSILSLVAFVAISALSTGCTTVQPGETGVRVLFGKQNETPYSPGFHFNGFANVHRISMQGITQTDQVEWQSTDAATVTFEETLQSVGYTAQLTWRIATPEAANGLYRDYGLRQGQELAFGAQRVIPQVRTAIKQEFPGYSLNRLFDEQNAAASDVQNRAQELIDQHFTLLPPRSVILDQVSFTNLDYADDLERSFAATVQEQQQTALALQTLERQRVVMQTQVAQAESDRRAAVERATGESEASRIAADAARYAREQSAEAEATFYRSISESGVDPNTYITMQTWNGNVPLVQGGSGGDDNMPLVLPLNMPGMSR